MGTRAPCVPGAWLYEAIGEPIKQLAKLIRASIKVTSQSKGTSQSPAWRLSSSLLSSDSTIAWERLAPRGAAAREGVLALPDAAAGGCRHGGAEAKVPPQG